MNRRGFIILDTATVYIVLAYVTVSMAVVYAVTMKAIPTLEQNSVEAFLAKELLEEVQQRPWDISTNTTFGFPIPANPIPSTAASSKAAITTIPQFNNWSESPPQDPAGNALTQFSGYSRTVSVSYVVGGTFATSASATSYRLIKVCAQYTKSGSSSCQQWLATQH